jgi:hypothetical protein
MAKNLQASYPCLETLWETEHRGDKFVEQIARQHSVQEATWVLLAAFSLIYNANQEQIGTGWIYLENLQFGQKEFI